MITRKQYLNHGSSHREYYAQFVNIRAKSLVKKFIGIDRLRESTDESFNDIPLKKWDSLIYFIDYESINKLKDAGDFLTIAGGVCLLKEAARQILEE